MLQQFSMDWKLHQKSFFGMLALVLGAGLFGMVMTCILMTVGDNPGSWFCLGTVIAAGMLCVAAVFFYGLSYSQEFQLALSMGRTRMAFLGAYAMRLVLQLLVGYGLVLAFHQVELRLYPALFRGFENELSLSFLTDWRIVLPLLLSLTTVSLFLGAVYARFGKNGLWVFYFLWMFCCLVLPRMVDVSAQDTGVLNRTAFWLVSLFRAAPMGFWIVFGTILFLSMPAAVIHMARRQTVK